jgi:tetratricopeptide (TPR) repeat protein
MRVFGPEILHCKKGRGPCTELGLRWALTHNGHPCSMLTLIRHVNSAMKSGKWFFRHAKAALANGSVQHARSLVARGLRGYPDDPKLTRLSSKLSNIAPDPAAERTYLARRVIESPSCFAPSVISGLAHELYNEKQAEEARAVLFRAIQEYPRELSLLRALRDMSRMGGKINESVSFATQVVERFSATPDDWLKLVEMLILTHRLEDAAKCILEGLRSHAQDKYLLALLSDLCRIKGDRDSALMHGLELISAHPNSWKGYERAFSDYIQMERFGQAGEVLKRGICDLGQPGLAKKLAGGLRFNFIYRFLSHPRNRVYMSAWHQAQVFCDPVGAISPIGMEVKMKGYKDITSELLDAKTQGPGAINVQPIQYWSQGTPPSDVSILAERWNVLLKGLSMPPIERFSRASAREWIHEYAPEYAVPFETSFHYSVESDVFRIAYASKRDCLYLDSDLWPYPWTSQTLKTLLSLNTTALYLRAYRPTISGCFFLSRLNCKFMRRLTRKCQNIDLSRLPRNASTVMNVFGPDKFTHCLRYELSRSSIATKVVRLQPGIVRVGSPLLDVALVNEYMMAAGAPPDGLAYKKTTQQWQIYLEHSSGATSVL